MSTHIHIARTPCEDGGRHQSDAPTSQITASKPPEATREREVAQSCPTLCDPRNCSPPGSSIHGTFQARILECHFLLQGIFPNQGSNPGLQQSHSPQKEPTKPTPSSHPSGLQEYETIHFHCPTVKEKGERGCWGKSDPLSSDFRMATTPHRELRLLTQATLG